MSVPTHIFTLLKDLIFFIVIDHLFLFNTHNMKPISRIQCIGVMFPYFTNTFGLFCRCKDRSDRNDLLPFTTLLNKQ